MVRVESDEEYYQMDALLNFDGTPIERNFQDHSPESAPYLARIQQAHQLMPLMDVAGVSSFLYLLSFGVNSDSLLSLFYPP